MELLRFENVSKYFGNQPVLHGINLSIHQGETIVLLGPSGCGKTTLLKLINALLIPEKGKILFNGKDIHSGPAHQLRRTIGYVIQDIGLLPHLTVMENLLLPTKLSKNNARKTDPFELLELVGLDEDISNRYPDALSGGQQQRIGIARALVNQPEVVLMDEPFSALDNITRTQLQDDFIRLENLTKKTIVLVTHDVQEAFKLADRIALLHEGKLQQIGTPLQLLEHPANDFVSGFLSENSFILKLKHLPYKGPGASKQSTLDILKNERYSSKTKLKAMEEFLNR